MMNIVRYKEGEESFIRYIKQRIRKNLNFIGLFQGGPGIGKTWSAISVSQMLDPNFSADQIVFDFKGLMNVLNSEWFGKKKWKVIIFDEPQITISNRNWQGLTNKLMNYLLTTFRHQNVILLFCSPYVDFLDSQSMKLLHVIFECVGVSRYNNTSRVRPKIQQYNSYLKKTYQHALQVVRYHKLIPLRDWYIPRPTPEIIDLYEKKKTEFTSELNKDILDKLNTTDGTKIKDLQSPNYSLSPGNITIPAGLIRRPLTKRQTEVMRVIANTGSYKEAALKLGVGLGTISETKTTVFRKGYVLEEFKEQNEKNPNVESSSNQKVPNLPTAHTYT